MLLLFLAAAAAAPAPAITPPPLTDNMPFQDLGAGNRQCPPISRYEAAKRGGKLKLTPLNELPTADMYNAVYRRIGGCIAPVIVRYGLGVR